MDKLYINQSLIKAFFYKGEKRDYCARKIHESEYTSDNMIKGSYFETLCLGSGAKGSVTNDLKRKKLTTKQILSGQKIGSKTIDQIRIEQQSLIFKNQKIELSNGEFIFLQLSVIPDINTQVKIYKKWEKDENVILHGELDIFPTPINLPERGTRQCCIDLKATGTFSDFGEYCWSTPSSMDHMQGYMYHYLMRNIDLELNLELEPESKLKYLYTGTIKKLLNEEEILFFYWVFNFKEKDLKNKIIEVPWNDMAQRELNEAIRKTVDEIKKNEENNWTNTNPLNGTNCKQCSILNCKSRIEFSKEEQEHNNFDTI